MTFLLGTIAAGVVSCLVILSGYTITGFLSRDNVLTRFALASVLGLAWVVFFASVAGAFSPLHGFVAWLTWTPVALTFLVTETRRQLISDISAGLRSTALP